MGTDATGYFATLAFRPSKYFNLSLEAENLSYDDPFTLVSPTDNRCIRLRARYNTDSGWGLSAAYTFYEASSDSIDGHLRWKIDDRFAVGYRW